jgi:hypothetical protein
MKYIKQLIKFIFFKKNKSKKQTPLSPAIEQKSSFEVVLKGVGDVSIDSWCVLSIDCPKGHVNDSGLIEWFPMEIKLYDPIGPSSSNQIYRWIKKYNFNPLIRSECPNIIYVKILDPNKDCVEMWRLINCRIVSFDFGDYSYEKNEPNIISIIIKPENCVLSQDQNEIWASEDYEVVLPPTEFELADEAVEEIN